MVHTYHTGIYYFPNTSKELFTISSDIKHVVTHTEMLWQPIKCAIKKARYNIVFATFAKKVRSVHKITTYFTLSSQSIANLDLKVTNSTTLVKINTINYVLNTVC